MFAYSHQTVDNRKGNGDGRVQKDEGLTMIPTVRKRRARLLLRDPGQPA
jgi:hypothetical protein